MSKRKKDKGKPKPLPFFRVEELMGGSEDREETKAVEIGQDKIPTMLTGQDWRKELVESVANHAADPDKTVMPRQLQKPGIQTLAPNHFPTLLPEPGIYVHDATTEPLSGQTDEDAGLAALDLSGSTIRSFDHLAELVDLAELNLSNTAIVDLSPIAKLSKLRRLDLSQTAVRDVEALRQLKNLEGLDLSETQVSDLRPLKGLRQLTTLRLRSTAVTNLVPLIGMTWLKEVDLKGCPVESLSPLRVIRKSAVIYLDQGMIDRIMRQKKEKLANMALGDWAKNRGDKR